MMKFSASKTLLFAGISACVLSAGAWRAEAATYLQTDLVSNIPGLATLTDSNLVNPWGVSYFGGSPFWVSDQGANVATLYAVTDSTHVSTVPLTVSIPTTTSGPPQGPTGQVANTNTSSFILANGANARFIFDNLNGTISAWNTAPGPAFVQVTTPGAAYTGLAINQTDTTLYAVNNAAGAIDVYNSSFTPEILPPNAFATPTDVAALGLTPFNAQDIKGNVYVTYAPATLQGQIDAGLGQGAVVEFGENGSLIKTLIGPSDNAQLAAPWGVALAPNTGFGPFSGDLLVGNFSTLHSEINAYNPTTGAFEGTIPVDPGVGNTAGGLWTLTFGTMGSNGSPDTLYFTDGINTNPTTGLADGLFGAIASVPEPSTWLMMLAGLGGLGLVSVRRRRSPLAIG